MTPAEAAIREALDAGPTPGPITLLDLMTLATAYADERVLAVRGRSSEEAVVAADAALRAALAEMVAELDRLRTENEALRADAERLDYIARTTRCDPKMDGQHVWWPTSFNRRLIGPNLRAAIDAAKGGA